MPRGFAGPKRIHLAVPRNATPEQTTSSYPYGALYFYAAFTFFSEQQTVVLAHSSIIFRITRCVMPTKTVVFCLLPIYGDCRHCANNTKEDCSRLFSSSSAFYARCQHRLFSSGCAL